MAGKKNLVKVLAVGVLLMACVALAALAKVIMDFDSQVQPELRKRIPAEQLRAASEYAAQVPLLFIARARSGADVVSMELRLEFINGRAHRRYLSKDLQVRDAIFQYLARRNPEKNALRYWQDIIDKGLQKHLATLFPEMKVSAILIEEFERM